MNGKYVAKLSIALFLITGITSLFWREPVLPALSVFIIFVILFQLGVNNRKDLNGQKVETKEKLGMTEIFVRLLAITFIGSVFRNFVWRTLSTVVSPGDRIFAAVSAFFTVSLFATRIGSWAKRYFVIQKMFSYDK